MKDYLSETTNKMIEEIKNILNESYVFNEDETSNNSIAPVKNGIGSSRPDNNQMRKDNNQFEDKVTQISKALMSLLSSLSPAKDAVKYKAIMGILTSVNKLFEAEVQAEPKI